MEHMLRRVEPPAPWVVVGETLAIGSEELVPYALGAWAKQGLGALADYYQERGWDDLAAFWRKKVVELGETRIADTALALTVGDGLRDLAERYADEGYLLLQQVWHLWSEYVKARAWQRVRIAHEVIDAR